VEGDAERLRQSEEGPRLDATVERTTAAQPVPQRGPLRSAARQRTRGEARVHRREDAADEPGKGPAERRQRQEERREEHCEEQELEADEGEEELPDIDGLGARVMEQGGR